VTTTGSAAGTSTITLTPQTGFSGSASVSVYGAPAGAQAMLGASQLSANGTTTLTLTPGTAAPGTYGVTVTGTRTGETETTSVNWTIASAQTCSHDLCTSGSKLTSGCDPCVTQICAADSYCCTTAWSSVCVAEVSSICGENTCSGGGSCAHAICSTGGKLASGCDSCVTQICAKDSFCCTSNWDSACVAEVGTICGETCN